LKPYEYDEVMDREASNPILSIKDWPYRAHSVFNPGATLLADGSTLLLCRVEDRRGLSHLTVARSKNGIDGWVVDSQPTFSPDPHEHSEELWGIEDPRITYCPDEDRYLIAYTAFGKSGPGVAIASTQDFKQFDRYGLAMQADDKDAAFFPRKFDGNYVLIHRPVTESSADIWISYSPDLKNWGGHKLLLPARRGGWWDAMKIGLCCPPIETSRGWILVYHGVRRHASGSIYRLGLALMDLEQPGICLLRGQSWIFAPEEPYEIMGDVGNVVFPGGYTVLDDGDTVHIYYGAADSCICLAKTSITKLLAALDQDGTTMTGIAGQIEERIQLNVPA
jgi:predicted GH43/DUF377 family glycosyl hydrolase